MSDSQADFDARIRSLGRKHRALEKTGSALKMRKDGLIVLKPRRAAAARGYIPIRGIAVLMLCFFAFKGYLWEALDEAGYNSRLAVLQNGTVVEQVGARLMKPDAVSLMFASAIADLKEQWRESGARS